MLVSHWMTVDPASLLPTAPLRDAIALMLKGRFRHVPIVEAGGLVGIVARSDLLREAPAHINIFSPALEALPSFELPVQQIMTRQPLVVHPEEPIERAAQLLVERKFGALPVVHGTRLMGIITETDVLRAFVAGFGEGMRITFELPEHEDAISFALPWSQAHAMRLVSVHSFVHNGRLVATVKLVGRETPGLLEALWSTGHKVISVVRNG